MCICIYICVYVRTYYSNHSILFGFFFTFIQFGILGWIRSGDGIHNSFVNRQFHRLFDFLFCPWELT